MDGVNECRAQTALRRVRNSLWATYRGSAMATIATTDTAAIDAL
jgi:hypothetical protein